MHGTESAASTQWVRSALGERPVPALAIVIGSDEGAALVALEQLRPDVRLLVLEPDARVAARLAASAAGQRRTAEGRWRCLAGPDYAGADEAWRVCPADPEDHVLLVSPPLAAARTEALAAGRVVGRVLYGARANAEARRQFAPRYLTNSLANLGAIARGSRLDVIDGVFTGRPGIVVGAGPSLDAVLPSLVDEAAKAVVFSTDTALRPLRHAGLSPQFVVGADPSEKNARHFFGLPPVDDTWLLAESALDPDAAAVFAGRTAWFRVATHDPWPWYHALGVDTTLVEMWGSVLTAAYQAALRAGCDPIIFVGADLAYTHGRPYARGTTYEFDWAYTATLGASLDEAWRQQIAMGTTLDVTGVDGRPVQTSQPLQAFRDWLVTQIARSGRRVVNATGGGILGGPGITQAPLADVLRGAPRLPRLTRARRATTATAFDRVADEVALARQVVAGGDTSRGLLAPWTAFTGSPLDLAALDSALARAEQTLRTAPSPESRAWVPWTALAEAAFTLPRLSSLPEGVGTMPAPPAPGAVAQGAVLLAATCEAIEQAPELDGGDVAPGQDPRHLVWPPPVAWPLRLFDAVLPAGAPADARDYFDTLMPAPGDLAPVPAATHLAGGLLARWLDAVSRSAAGADAPTVSRLRGLARAVAAPVHDDGGGTHVLTLGLSAQPRGTWTTTRQVSRRVAARAMTGTLLAAPGGTARRDALVRLRTCEADVHITACGARAVVTPRVLTDEGLPRATAAHNVGEGVVVVPLHADHSLWIGERGEVRRHHDWPAPIIGELPMGVSGAVAWSNGTAAMDAIGEGYLLYRETPAGPVTRVALPFRPTAGAWFGGRLYWNTFRQGLGVWTPGEAPALLLADESFCGVVADGPRLVLAPMTRDADGRAVRRVHTQTLALDDTGTLTVVALDERGAGASQAMGETWRASACPDVDLVRLDDGARCIDLVCHFPMAVAWSGRSLVVCTAAGEVLLFERLADTLDPLR